MVSTTAWVITGVVAVVTAYIAYNWVVIFNKFQYWINRAERKFHDIDVIMQQRIDMLPALAQVIKKYDIHEYKALKDVIEARSRWSKDAALNDKVKAADKIENNFLKIQAVIERYPKLKAVVLHDKLLGHGNISRVEYRLREARLGYNRVVQEYNERVAKFPRNIVAKVHGFKKLDYLTLGNQVNQDPQETYRPKEIFED